MNRISEKVIALLLVVFLLSYVGYQLYEYYYNPLQMETTFDYTVEQNLLVDGIVVRSETVIEERGAGGVETSAVENGARVAVGQTVVEYYASSLGDTQIKRMRELEKAIAALEDAQNPLTSNFSNSEAFTRNIRDQMSTLTQMSSTGRFQNVGEVRGELESQINKKQISIGKERSYQPRIDSLRAEYDRLQGNASLSSADVVTSPLAGYFVSSVDGMEDYTVDTLRGYTIADYRSVIEGRRAESSSAKVGKIVTDSLWYYAVLVSKYDVEWMQEGHPVTIQFDEVDDAVPGIVEELLFENGEEDAVLLIRINHVSGELLQLRHASAVINIEQYSGLRINTSSIRFQNEERGVYILSRRTVRFKKIDPIYEEAGFLISRDTTDADYVRQFDQIITKGMDLYDGKVIE